MPERHLPRSCIRSKAAAKPALSDSMQRDARRPRGNALAVLLRCATSSAHAAPLVTARREALTGSMGARRARTVTRPHVVRAVASSALCRRTDDLSH